MYITIDNAQGATAAFAIDHKAIKLRSNKTDHIELAYSGTTPTEAETACIIISILPRMEIDMRLVCCNSDGRTSYHVEASRAEMVALLDRFFRASTHGSNKGSGMDGYWFGVYQGIYYCWRELTGNPWIAASALSERFPEIGSTIRHLTSEAWNAELRAS